MKIIFTLKCQLAKNIFCFNKYKFTYIYISKFWNVSTLHDIYSIATCSLFIVFVIYGRSGHLEILSIDQLNLLIIFLSYPTIKYVTCGLVILNSASERLFIINSVFFENLQFFSLVVKRDIKLLIIRKMLLETLI